MEEGQPPAKKPARGGGQGGGAKGEAASNKVHSRSVQAGKAASSSKRMGMLRSATKTATLTTLGSNCISGFGCTDEVTFQMPIIASTPNGDSLCRLFFESKSCYQDCIAWVPRYQPVAADAVEGQPRVVMYPQDKFQITTRYSRQPNLNTRTENFSVTAEAYGSKNGNGVTERTNIIWKSPVDVRSLRDITTKFLIKAGMLDYKKVGYILSSRLNLPPNTISPLSSSINSALNVYDCTGFYAKAFFILLQDIRNAANGRPVNVNNLQSDYLRIHRLGIQPDQNNTNFQELANIAASGQLACMWECEVNPLTLPFLYHISKFGIINQPADWDDANSFPSDHIYWQPIFIHVIVLPYPTTGCPANVPNVRLNFPLCIGLLKTIARKTFTEESLVQGMYEAFRIYFCDYLNRYPATRLANGPKHWAVPYIQVVDGVRNCNFTYTVYLALDNDAQHPDLTKLVADTTAAMCLTPEEITAMAVAAPTGEALDNVNQLNRIVRRKILAIELPAQYNPPVQSNRLILSDLGCYDYYSFPKNVWPNWVVVNFLETKRPTPFINPRSELADSIISHPASEFLVLGALFSMLESTAVSTMLGNLQLNGNDLNALLSRGERVENNAMMSSMLNIISAKGAPGAMSPVQRYTSRFLTMTANMTLPERPMTFRQWANISSNSRRYQDGEWFAVQWPNHAFRKFKLMAMGVFLDHRPLEWGSFSNHVELDLVKEIKFRQTGANLSGWWSKYSTEDADLYSAIMRDKLYVLFLPYPQAVINAIIGIHFEMDTFPVLMCTRFQSYEPQPAPAAWNIRENEELFHNHILEPFALPTYNYLSAQVSLPCILDEQNPNAPWNSVSLKAIKATPQSAAIYTKNRAQAEYHLIAADGMPGGIWDAAAQPTFFEMTKIPIELNPRTGDLLYKKTTKIPIELKPRTGDLLFARDTKSSEPSTNQEIQPTSEKVLSCDFQECFHSADGMPGEIWNAAAQPMFFPPKYPRTEIAINPNTGDIEQLY